VSDVIEQEPETTALTVVQRAAVALGADKHEQELVALSKQYTDIVEIKNNAGRDQCHAAAMVLSKAITHTDKTGKEAREDANAFQKAVIVEVKRRIAIIESERDRLIALRDEWDAARAAEKAAIAATEAARIAAIRAKIDVMRNKPASMVGQPSAEIGVAADHLSETVIGLDEYAELAGEAQVERNHAVTKLREMQAAQQAIEQAAAESARQAEAERAERGRVAAEQKAEAKRLADLAEEIERKAAAARAAQEKADREAATARAARERKDREAREAFDAERRSQQVAHEALTAKQQAAADLIAAATSEIQGIQQQVIIAQSGRLGVRKGGTIHCIRETLAETEAWEIDPERFGILAGAAESAKTTAVAEIRRLLAEAERKESEALTQQLDADHGEALSENARIDAEREAAAEAARVQAEREAAEAERIHRELVQFEQNGPGDVEIVKRLAADYGVTVGDVMQWMKKFDSAATDELLAAENVAANPTEKAA